MSISKRQEEILELLNEHSFLTVERLATLTYTSPSSIRRDLTRLQNLSLIKRTHGGASIFNAIHQSVPLNSRMSQSIAEKRKIAKREKEEKKEQTREVIRATEGYGDRVNPDRMKNLGAAGAEDTILGILTLYPELIPEAMTKVGLTEEERLEQSELRREFIEGYRRSLVAQLENTYIIDEHGNKTKLRRRDEPSESQ